MLTGIVVLCVVAGYWISKPVIAAYRAFTGASHL
jgi:hypothetical protein